MKNFKFNDDVKIIGKGFYGGSLGVVKSRRTKKDGVYFSVSFKTAHREIVTYEFQEERLEKYQ